MKILTTTAIAHNKYSLADKKMTVAEVHVLQRYIKIHVYVQNDE